MTAGLYDDAPVENEFSHGVEDDDEDGDADGWVDGGDGDEFNHGIVEIMLKIFLHFVNFFRPRWKACYPRWKALEAHALQTIVRRPMR